MEDYSLKEFVAYSRKLLRALKKIKIMIENDEKEKALQELEEMIADTEKDIEA